MPHRFDINVPIAIFTGNKEPNLNLEGFNQLLEELAKFSDAHEIAVLKESGVVYWLTYALDYAVSENLSEAIADLCKLINNSANKNPEIFVGMLSQPFSAGKFNEQTAIDVWFDTLYSATFEESNVKIIEQLVHMFTLLLERVPTKLVPALVKNYDDTSSPLLSILLALYNASHSVDNGSMTAPLAEYLRVCTQNAVSVFSPILTQEIHSGPVKDKDMLYLVASTLTEVVKWSPETVKSLCALLVEVGNAKPSEYRFSLTRLIEQGPHAGLHTLDILLMSLVSALHIANNGQAVSFLLNMLNFSIIPSEAHNIVILNALTKVENPETSPNGIMILVRALAVAVNRGYSADAIISMLSSLLSSDFSLTSAFIQRAASNEVGFYNISAVEQLIALYPHINDLMHKTRVLDLITQLVKSNDAPKIIATLPDDPRTFFVQEFAKVYSLTKGQQTLILAADQSSMKAHSSSPREFITHFCALPGSVGGAQVAVRLFKSSVSAPSDSTPSDSASSARSGAGEGKEEYEPTKNKTR